eukprot:TRINITY_DN1454_c3_g1_i1.p1 TRINITY_DN1454_c3_g1~~TRINITY_DN1454_c3_g1_i1.p1  ORF type:complete len:302 (+),score=38.26 TRINITY_DN1454_c3_g1_i1:43-906(+)
MTAYQKGVFRTDAPPLHVGRKANQELAERRSQSADFHKKNKIECTATRDHLVVGKAPCVEHPTPKPHKHLVDGVRANKSRCPWDVAQLSARNKHKGRKNVDTSTYYREKKFGKGSGLAPVWESDAAAKFVYPDREGGGAPNKKKTDPNKSGGSVESTVERRWKPSRKHLECSKSQSAEYAPPHKQLSYQRRSSATSLWGPEPGPAKVTRSASAELRPRSRSPFATSFDLPQAKPSPLNIEPSRSCPYDANYRPSQGPTHMEPGKRNEFRPRTRIFSASDSRQKIFGF